MPRPKGTKKGLTDQEKKQILELRNQGLSKDKISMQLHIVAYRITDYLKEVGDTDQRGSEKADINMELFTQKVFAGEKLDALCKTFGISKPTCVNLKKKVIKDRDEKSVSDYDLTVLEKEDDNWKVTDIIRALGNDSAKLLTFKVHQELTIGGERTVWQAHEDGTRTFDKKELYPTEVHKFDIIIPEIKMIIIPVSSYEEVVMWWEEHISKKVDPIFKVMDYGGSYNQSYFHLLATGVSKYDLVFCDDIKSIVHRIEISMMNHNIGQTSSPLMESGQTCTNCQYRKECSFTYCKARGEAYKSPLDLEYLRVNHRKNPSGEGGLAGWSKESSEAIQKINEEEYKYWDERGRIGKPGEHSRPALTNEELKDATGIDNNDDVVMMAEIKMKHITIPRSVDPGKDFPSMSEVREFLKNN